MGWLTLGSLAAPYHGRMDHPTLRAAAAALAGALLVYLLAAPLGVTAGLLVAAGVVGWLGALAVRSAAGTARRPLALGATLGGLTMGLVATWAASLATGGALGPIEFLAETLGLVVPILYLVGLVVAWVAVGRRS